MPLYDVNANPIPDELLPSSQPVDPDNPPLHAGHHDPVAQQLSDITRRQEILKLRIQGYSHQQIADKLGGTPQSIEAIIRIAINKIDKLSGKNIEKLKQRELRMEILRLDEFLVALIPALAGQDRRVTTARAIEIALKIGERRAKLLGLDQPEKQQVLNLNAEVEGLSADQLEARAREVGITLVDLPQEPLPLPAPLDALPAPAPSLPETLPVSLPEQSSDPAQTALPDAAGP